MTAPGTALLATFDLAVFAPDEAGGFRALAPPPAWMDEVVPGSDAAGAVELMGHDPYLDTYLAELEGRWEDEPPPPGSGIWMAETAAGEVPLEARIARFEGAPILVIQCLRSFFSETERQLQLSREHLLVHERLTREIDRKQVLVHCVVHDLNSPLASMRLALEMAQDSDDPATMRKMIATALRQVERQSGLVEDILEAYKSEAQALTEGASSRLTGAEVAACLAAVGEDLATNHRRKRIALVLDIAPGLEAVEVRGSEKRLRRAVLNMADNATRIAPRGSTLTLRLRPDAGGLRVVVDDEGPGLAENASYEIFRKLRQGRGGKGKVGLGLYYCRITARSWGGDVGCANRDDAPTGARFWIQLVTPGPAPAG